MPTEKEFLAKKALLDTKQDKLTAGTNIQIDPVTNRISAINDAEIIDVQVNGTSVVGVDKIARVNVDTVEPNPTSTPTDTLTSVDINGTIYELQGGGGNADYIELTQAEYNALTPAEKNNGKMYFIIDGESGPTNIVTNVIVNGVSVVTNKIASFSVPEVEANPTGTATDTLNTVDIDGTIYEIQGGGGGSTTVIPNPQGTPTDTLNTIGINDTIFDIASGGGSGSGVYIEEVLWEGTAITSAWASPIELAIDIEPYDFIVVQIYNSMHVLSSRQIPTGTISGDIFIAVGGYLSGDGVNNRAVWLNKDTNLLRIFTSTGTSIEVKKIVGIKVSGNYFTPQIYSTEEQEVGVWIDGRPLYQVTLTQNEVPALSNTGQTRHINLGLSNIENIWVMDASIGSNNTINIPYIHYDTRNLFGYFWDMNNGSPILEVRAGIDSSAFVINCITLQYTKSTDTPGSGSWASNGVPAHHYSTEEQVVGTWLDGSTVYEKTWDLGEDTTYSPGWHLLSFPKGNINRIFDGLLISDAGLSCNVGLACNDATYLEILVYSGPSQVLGRYIKARYTKSS